MMRMVIIMYALGHATSLLLNIGMYIADAVVHAVVKVNISCGLNAGAKVMILQG